MLTSFGIQKYDILIKLTEYYSKESRFPTSEELSAYWNVDLKLLQKQLARLRAEGLITMYGGLIELSIRGTRFLESRERFLKSTT